MKINLTRQFKEDLVKLKHENKKLLGKILELIVAADDSSKNPLNGIGKPEYLKGNLSGCLSRRIDSKHRLIYEIKENELTLLSCYGHYSDR